MIYTFVCNGCGKHEPVRASIKDGPPDPFLHGGMCKGMLVRLWEPPQLLLRDDPDEIDERSRLADSGLRPISRGEAARKERTYGRYIEERRRVFRDNGQVGGRMTHQVPTELYHGKINQTGDKDYWRDPANLNRHKSCKVS